MSTTSRLLPPPWARPSCHALSAPARSYTITNEGSFGVPALEGHIVTDWGAGMSDEDCLQYADVVKVRMQLHSLQMAGDGRLLAPNPNLVSAPTVAVEALHSLEASSAACN